MGIYVNPDNANFQISLNSRIYVDKSPLIEILNHQIGTQARFLCISRPRRFGKSMTAEMLCAYYSKGCDSSHQFESLKISKLSSFYEHLNAHNVIFLNMQLFWERAKGNIYSCINDINAFVKAELTKIFPKIELSAVSELYDVLNVIYEETGENFIFIVDEWDCIMRERRRHDDAAETYLSYLNALFKGHKYVALAYMTGILPIRKYGTNSILNMFDEVSMTEPGEFAQFIGFTEEEVRELCQQYGCDFLLMKRWYDGYSFDEAPHIYNPNSVVKAITKKKFLSYWSQTETYEMLRRYIDLNLDGLRDDVSSMIAGDEVEFNPGKFQNDMLIFEGKDDVLALLVHLGYLAVRIRINADATSHYFARIPNQEIRGEFINSIENNVNYAGTWKAIATSQKLLEAIWEFDAETVAHGIERAHEENSSILRYNDENSLACVISNALYHARSYYHMVRELPTGKGFADIVYLPLKNVDKPALLVELKKDISSQVAISQIKEKHYTSFFSD